MSSDPSDKYDEVYELGMQMLNAQDELTEIYKIDENGKEYLLRFHISEEVILEDLKDYTKILEQHNSEKANGNLKLAMLHLDQAALYLDVYLKERNNGSP